MHPSEQKSLDLEGSPERPKNLLQGNKAKKTAGLE